MRTTDFIAALASNVVVSTASATKALDLVGIPATRDSAAALVLDFRVGSRGNVMTEVSIPSAPDALLAHTSWMRRLASTLVLEEDADDIVQQTWLAALKKPPRHGTNLRAWIGKAVRNTARQQGRSHSRRSRREQSSLPRESAPSTAHLVEQAEMQRQVVSAVLRLAEPYRSTVLLRYYQDESPKQIAQMQGVPAATVRSRLQRGLRQLRQLLDQKFGGDRRAWGAALLPLAGRGTCAALLAKAGPVSLAGKSGLIWTAATVAFATLLGWMVIPELFRSEIPAATSGSSAMTGVLPMHRDAVTNGLAPRTSWTEPAQVTTSSPEAADPRVVELHGHVVDRESGHPLAGVSISVGSMVVQTDARGEYRVLHAAVARNVALLATATGYAPRRAHAVLSDEPTARCDFALARGVPLRITTFDRATGAGIAGARIRVSEHDRVIGQTASDGSFELFVTPEELLSLELEAQGYADLSWEWQVGNVEQLQEVWIPMARIGWIEGSVTDMHGAALGEVWLWVTNAAFPSARWDLRPAEGNGSQLPGTGRYRLPSTFGETRQRIDRGPTVRSIGKGLRVFGADGQPSYLLCTESPLVGARTDERGEFRVPVVTDASPYVLQVGTRNHVAATRGPILVDSHAQLARMTIVLQPAGIVRGQAMHGETPWHNRGFLHWIASAGREGSAAPDDSGAYEIFGIPPGVIEIEARDRHSELPPKTASLVVRAGETRIHDFVWESASASIRGRVTNPRGGPVAGVRVSAHVSSGTSHTSETRTEADGSYSLPVEFGVAYQVTVRRRPQVISQPYVPAGRANVDFVLGDLGTARLHIIDAATGEVIRGVGASDLSWRNTGDDTFQSVEEVTRDGDVIELTVPTGVVDLDVHPSQGGYAPQIVRGVAIDSATGSPVEIELRRGIAVALEFDGGAALRDRLQQRRLLFLLEESQIASIRGPFPAATVESNANIAGVRVWLDRPSLIGRLLAIGPNDRATLEGLAPGRYALRAFPDDLVFEPAGFDLTEAKTVRVRWKQR